VLIPRRLARTIGLGLPPEQLRVDTVALDKSVDVITTEPTALVALDGDDVELADDNRAVAGASQPPLNPQRALHLRRCGFYVLLFPRLRRSQ
jgi:hypothetical protein